MSDLSSYVCASDLDRPAETEGHAAQFGIGDDVTRRRKAESRTADDKALRLTIACDISGVVDHVPTLLVPVARHPVQSLLHRDFAVEQDMAAAGGEGLARRQRRAVAGGVAIGGEPIFGRCLAPGVFLFGVEGIGRGSGREGGWKVGAI